MERKRKKEQQQCKRKNEKGNEEVGGWRHIAPPKCKGVLSTGVRSFVADRKQGHEKRIQIQFGGKSMSFFLSLQKLVHGHA